MCLFILILLPLVFASLCPENQSKEKIVNEIFMLPHFCILHINDIQGDGNIRVIYDLKWTDLLENRSCEFSSDAYFFYLLVICGRL